MENWRDGEYPAGYMEIDGEAVGFTVGDIVGDTLFVHVEKCLRDISGVYEATTNAFLKRHVTDAVKFVNREEDMGIEGLRKSKMSSELLLSPYSLCGVFVPPPLVLLSYMLRKVPTERLSCLTELMKR